ncbi:ABC transporter substrate-binding protein [Streptomyces sp. NPDC047097]|uniref:ABC transporter substrate-binding protein n=1 Tax=Streptomyces sp. NPDC047097 TaxID=3155260 RepID=UPI0033CB6953
MRSVRLGTLLVCGALVAGGVVAATWQLWPQDATRSGPITVGTTDEVSSLDPAGAYDAGSWALFGNVYQSLLTFTSGSTLPVPDAAKRCAFTDTGLRTYRCRLRDGLTFADGRPVTGADVKHSFDRLRAIASDVGPAPIFASLRTVDAAGPEVTFHLAARDATFPHKLATGAGAIVERGSYPAKALRKSAGINGSGPYLLTAYEPGKRARLEPNPRYRGAVSRPGAPVEIRYFKESAALAAAWKERRVDVAHRQLPPQELAALEDGAEDGATITQAGSAETRNLVFSLRKGSPAADRAVRRAVAALLDRSQIAAGPYHSTVEPLYSVIPRGVLGHNNAFHDEYPAPSAERAAQLLRDAGIPTPVRLTYGHRSGAAYAEEAVELRRQLENGGLFELDVVTADWQDFQRGYADGAYDMYGLGWLADFPDPDSFAQPLVGRGSTLRNGYASKQVDRLIAATQQYGDRAKSVRDFGALQREVAKDVPLLPLWQNKEYVLSTEDVTGAQYLSDGTGIWRLWELRWI